MRATIRRSSLRCWVLAPALVSAIAAATVTGGVASAGTTATASSGLVATTSSTGTSTRGAVPSAARSQHPRIVTAWASAWNNGNPEQMAALFTRDGTYQDFAFGATFRGRTEVASWVTTTTTAIDNVHIEVTDAFRAGDRVSVRFTFSGQIVGAPTPFAVPASTVMELERGKINYNGDYYNLADVLRQSGLPAAGGSPATGP